MCEQLVANNIFAEHPDFPYASMMCIMFPSTVRASLASAGTGAVSQTKWRSANTELTKWGVFSRHELDNYYMLLIFFGHITYLWKIDENCPLIDDKYDDLPMIYK